MNETGFSSEIAVADSSESFNLAARQIEETLDRGDFNLENLQAIEAKLSETSNNYIDTRRAKATTEELVAAVEVLDNLSKKIGDVIDDIQDTDQNSQYIKAELGRIMSCLNEPKLDFGQEIARRNYRAPNNDGQEDGLEIKEEVT